MIKLCLLAAYLIGPAVSEHLKNVEPSTRPISIVKQVTKELWDNEDWEIRKTVVEAVAKAQNVAINPDEGDSSQCTPQQYQE